MEFIKPGWHYDFMGKRWYFIGASLVMMAISIVLMFVPGPRMGTDFRGGTEVEVAFSKPVDVAQLRTIVEQAGFEGPEVINVTDQQPNQYLIRVQQEGGGLGEEKQAALREKLCFFGEGIAVDEARCPVDRRATEVKFSPGGDRIFSRYEAKPDLAAVRDQIAGIPGVALQEEQTNPVLVSERDNKVEIRLKSKADQLMDSMRSALGADVVPEKPLRVEWIGPKAGAQLRNAAIKSIVIAIFFIMAYIALRFDIRFAPGGIFALIHDVIIAIGALIITHREITLTTVAALLTIVGYSITDTVVVYDRIRENLAKHRTMTFSEVINLSISEMFGRTIITALCTSFSLLGMLFFGTSVIKDFAFAFLIGMVAGTLSSIYVAAPLTEIVDRKFFGRNSTKPRPISRTRSDKRADAVV